MLNKISHCYDKCMHNLPAKWRWETEVINKKKLLKFKKVQKWFHDSVKSLLKRQKRYLLKKNSTAKKYYFGCKHCPLHLLHGYSGPNRMNNNAQSNVFKEKKTTPKWKPQRPLYMPRAIFNFRVFRFAVIFLCFIVCARALVAAGYFFLSLGYSVNLVFLFGATDALPNG